MQERHTNREIYFNELARTSELFFMPYIENFKRIDNGCRVLEIGCGDGGNLLPFAKRGCRTLGVDISEGRIDDARNFFAINNAAGEFIASDIFKLNERQKSSFSRAFDVIICHDVIEHISDKRCFLSLLPRFLADDGVAFISFPAWQMPFGGHQQICRSKIVSHLPFVHLLSTALYRSFLKVAGESKERINELLEIKRTRTPIELFERSVAATPTLAIANRTLWLINPHYETKFGLRPRRLPRLIARLPYVCNFFTTSCFYILKCHGAKQN